MKFTDPEQVISSTEKVKLLGFLRRTHGKHEAPVETNSSPRQITLKRRTVSEITVTPGQRGAQAKTVNVEVRQKRTYVKRSVVEEEANAQVDPEREDAITQARGIAAQARGRRGRARRCRAPSPGRRRQAARVRRSDARRRRRGSARARPKRKRRRETTPDAKPRRDARRRPPAKEAERPRHDRPARARPMVRTSTSRSTARTACRRARPKSRNGAAPRYFGAELHLSQEGSARRTGRKKPKARQVEQARSGPAHAFSRPTAPVVREVSVGESITVAELANKMAVKGARSRQDSCSRWA